MIEDDAVLADVVLLADAIVEQCGPAAAALAGRITDLIAPEPDGVILLALAFAMAAVVTDRAEGGISREMATLVVVELLDRMTGP